LRCLFRISRCQSSNGMRASTISPSRDSPPMNTTGEKATSASSVYFDHDPTDAELTRPLKISERSVCLGGLKVVETFGIFRVRPAGLPIIWIMLSMVLGGVVFTVVPMLLPFECSPVNRLILWIWIACCWGIIAFWAVMLALVNRWISQKEDYFHADITHGTLTLSRESRTLRTAEIVVFTEVCRYVRCEGFLSGWTTSLQTGVLVRTADGGMKLHALADGKTRPPLADQLASIFRVPVRRVIVDPRVQNKA
jgi:hypothetical protein